MLEFLYQNTLYRSFIKSKLKKKHTLQWNVYFCFFLLIEMYGLFSFCEGGEGIAVLTILTSLVFSKYYEGLHKIVLNYYTTSPQMYPNINRTIYIKYIEVILTILLAFNLI